MWVRLYVWGECTYVRVLLVLLAALLLAGTISQSAGEAGHRLHQDSGGGTREGVRGDESEWVLSASYCTYVRTYILYSIVYVLTHHIYIHAMQHMGRCIRMYIRTYICTSWGISQQ